MLTTLLRKTKPVPQRSTDMQKLFPRRKAPPHRHNLLFLQNIPYAFNTVCNAAPITDHPHKPETGHRNGFFIYFIKSIYCLSFPTFFLPHFYHRLHNLLVPNRSAVSFIFFSTNSYNSCHFFPVFMVFHPQGSTCCVIKASISPRSIAHC